jgi:hypothetical protein
MLLPQFQVSTVMGKKKLPACLAYDSFTRADGALGSTEATGPEGQVLTPPEWTAVEGTGAISSGRIQATNVGGGIALFTIDPGQQNIDVSAKLYLDNSDGGIILHCVNAANRIEAIYSKYYGGVRFWTYVDGVATTLIDVATAYVDGAAIRCVLVDNVATVYYNGVQIGDPQAVSASLVTTCGISFYTVELTSLADNFLVRPA